MSLHRLLTVVVIVLMSYNGSAQWGALAKLFSRGAGEAAAAKAAARSFEQAAAARATARTFEEAAARSVPRFSPGGLPHTNTDAYETLSRLGLEELTADERLALQEYLSTASPIEVLRLRYMSKYSLKDFIRNLEAKAKPTVISGYELYAEPALTYSAATITIQKELRKRGYNVQVDGRFGNETKMAAAKALKQNALIEFPHEQALLISKRDLFKKYRSKFIALHKDNLINKLEFNHNNSLVLSRQVNIKDQGELNEIINYYNDFFKNFEHKNEAFRNARFMTIYNSESSTYLGFHFKNTHAEGVSGGLFNFSQATEKQKETYFELFFKDPNVKRIYVYGDHLSDLNKIIREKAMEHKVTVINRNASFKKSFDQTEASLRKLGNKKIDYTKLTFMNGTPNSTDEALFQQFPIEHTDLLKSFNAELNSAVLPKKASVISSKEELIKELTTGENDFLFIVAHCDGENVYFGSSMVSISDLKALPKRTGRKKPRIAVLFSCTTGDIYRNMPFVNDPKTFAEVIVEKNFFDLAIAPPGTIDGNDVLRMTEIIDKHPVQQLYNYLSAQMEEGQMRNLGKLFEFKKDGSGPITFLTK